MLDLGAFIQTLMLSAVGHGLQTMPAYETVKCPRIVRSHMDIPDTEVLAIGVGLGHADDSRTNEFVPDRAPLEATLNARS